MLYPPGVGGMVNLDVWSGPHVFNEKCERLRHTTREDLRQTMQAELINKFRLRSELADPLAPLVRAWEEGFSDEFLAVKPSLAQEYEAAAVASARAMTVAARQLQLFEAMVATLPLTDKERERIAETDALWLPMLRAG